MIAPTLQRQLQNILFLLVTILVAKDGAAQVTAKQQKEPEPAAPSLCTRDNGLEMVREQVATSRLLDDVSRRITVMVRAGDLLWVADQRTARDVFKAALKLANDDYQEKRSKNAATSDSFVDQRNKVIAAIAKRDLNWSREVLAEVLKEQEDRASSADTNSTDINAGNAERLLSIALAVLSSDQTAAIRFATTSLRYPATLYLPVFLYKLSALDKVAADQLYQSALSAYAESPMSQFLFLSSYPFGNNREAGEMPNWTVYTVPPNFRTNLTLQRLFVETLLRRAQLLTLNSSATSSGARFSDREQAWLALTRLQPQIDQFVPNLSEQTEAIKNALFGTSNQTDQQRLSNVTASPSKKSFQESVEDAVALRDPARREQQLALLILRSKDEPIQQVLEATGKIENIELRENLLSWLYFEWSQHAIHDDWREAQKLAEKVSELDLRAYLFARIAEQSISYTKVDADARDLLEIVLATVAKAPDTAPKARALLGIAHLYAQIDVNRSVAVLAEAVKCINRVEIADLSQGYIERKLQGKTFTTYAILHTPGFNPENSFRQIAKVDFDGALVLVATISDKYLRSTVTLTLAEPCLQTANRVQSRTKAQ